MKHLFFLILLLPASYIWSQEPVVTTEQLQKLQQDVRHLKGTDRGIKSKLNQVGTDLKMMDAKVAECKAWHDSTLVKLDTLNQYYQQLKSSHEKDLCLVKTRIKCVCITGIVLFAVVVLLLFILLTFHKRNYKKQIGELILKVSTLQADLEYKIDETQNKCLRELEKHKRERHTNQ